MPIVTMYVDTDGGGSNTSPFDTWAKATSKLETALEDAACDEGSTIYMQGAAPDSQTIAVTLTSEGTEGYPVRVIGCKDGTTAEPPVAADYSTRAGADMPKFELITTAGIDLTITGSISFRGIEFDIVDIFGGGVNGAGFYLTDCKITSFRFHGGNDGAFCIATHCEIIGNDTGAGGRGSNIVYIDCLIKSSSTGWIFIDSSRGWGEVIGCDLSDAGNDINIARGISMGRPFIIRNCKLKSTWAVHSSPTLGVGYTELISCNGNTAARGSNTSFQDYEKVSQHGTVDAESVILRTGGADDGADGAFSYAMVNFASAALQGRPGAAIDTPWMSVWVPGGSSKILTIYITNDGAGDLNGDVIWCEFFTPDANDTTQHTVSYVPSLIDRADGANAIADDTVSTWVTHNTNKQKFSITVTPGYEGWAYARVFLAQNSATPDVVYIDPKIEVV